MAGKGIFSRASLKRLVWGFGLWASLLLLLAAGGLLWFSGARDGEQAFFDGRRLVITLETGVIEGRRVPLPRPGAPQPDEAGEKAKEGEEGEQEKEPPVKEEAKSDAAAEPSGEEAAKSDPEADAQEMEAGDKASEPMPTDADATAKDLKDGHLLDTVVPSVSAVRGVHENLTVKSREGVLPRIGEDGTKPWEYYAKPFDDKDNALPMVAIIVTGLGTNKNLTEQAIRLPEPVTLSFSPYARNVETWATAARATGHEVMVDLPVQPADYPASDPGPYGLLVEARKEDNDKKLNWLMSRFGAFIGFLLPLNDGFSSDTNSLANLLEAVSGRGLLLALPRDLAKDEAKQMAGSAQTPVLIADVLLDEELNEKAIQARIATLQQRARERGYALGIAQSYPVTFEQLARLPERLASGGLMLVPASAVARRHTQGR